MKQNILGLFFTLTIAATLCSCKKETALPAETALQQPAKEQLKEWYAGQTAKGQPDGEKIKFYLNAGTPDWDNAKQVGNTYITPVIISGNKGRGQKFLVTSIAANGNLASGKYVYVIKNKEAATAVPYSLLNEILTTQKAPAGFTGSMVEYNLKHELIAAASFENGILDAAKVVNVNWRPKVNNAAASKDPEIVPNYANPCEGEQGTCIDWYWQTFVDGVLVDEEYLYTTCHCGGGGGGSSETTCQQQNQNFASQGMVNNGPITSVDEYNDGTTWIKSYNWPIFTVGTWGLLSYEKGTMEKKYYPSNNTTRWEYQSFEHVLIAEVGVVVGGSRTFQDLGATINMTSTNTSAWVQVAFSVSSKSSCWFGNPVVIPYNANKTFRAPNSIVPQ